MRKTYLITAIVLLSAVWLAAQSTPGTPQSTSPQTTSPSSTSPSEQSSTPSQQSSAPDAAQTSTDTASSIEGCVGGSAGNWTLTDQTGKTWQLAGDTAKLGDHVGHQVRILGSDNSKGSDTSSGASSPSTGSSSPSSGSSSSTGSASSSSTGAGSSSGSQPTFNVRKVKMISSSCSTGK